MTRPTRDARGNAPVRPQPQQSFGRAVLVMLLGLVVLVGIAVVVAAWRT